MKTRKMLENSGGGRLLLAMLFIATHTGVLAVRNPELVILPSQAVQTKPIGKNVLLTCRANVENLPLLTDMQWLDPNNRTILNNDVMYTNNPQRMHTELMPSALALIIPSLRETEAGTYTCTATYANSEKLYKSVRIETIVAITWEDAPEEQFPILNKDFKVRCKVTAQPAPQVDWMRNGEIISTGGRYVVETDGLTIQKPVESDDGVYTCRAIVVQTGELAQRDIRVEVHTPPAFEDMLPSTKIVEGDTATIKCHARGKPRPFFSWIKASTQQNMGTADRFKVNQLTGDMIISGVRPEDSGEYKCVASNKASTVEKTVLVNVLVKPRIGEFRNLSVPIQSEVRMECRATGNPVPTITFRKLNQQARPYVMGRQPTDQRIEQSSVEDPNRRGEAVGTLRISPLGRYDDGLYVCIASNEGGESMKNGHLSIQFPPSFSSTPIDVWSWGSNPVNISCLAESIPNATITWKLNDRELERDPNVHKFSSGPQSVIKITPRRRDYYGVYRCIATNILGTAETTITLKEAVPPSEILQAKVIAITATTITFSFLGPQNHGGRPLKAFAVQFKPSAQGWEYASNKTWPADSTYVIEKLEPQMRYNFRFAAANEVGFSNWAANLEITMPQRAVPEEPRILNPLIDGGYVVSPYSDRMEVRWKIPADNGEPIDKYQIRYCPVKRDFNEYFVETSICEILLIPQDHSSVELKMLQPDTYYKVELQAHNMMGYSIPGKAIFKTARDPHVTAAESLFIMSSGVIVGVVVASLVVLLLLIDLFCFCVNSTGLLMLMCDAFRGKPKDEDAKLGGEEKEPLKEMNGLNGKDKMSIEIMPMMQDNSVKKETMVDYDFKNAIARTGFVGKDSAV